MQNAFFVGTDPRFQGQQRARSWSRSTTCGGRREDGLVRRALSPVLRHAGQGARVQEPSSTPRSTGGQAGTSTPSTTTAPTTGTEPGTTVAGVPRLIDAVSVTAKWSGSSCLFGDGAAELSSVSYHLLKKQPVSCGIN
jgi:hypothetical protein